MHFFFTLTSILGCISRGRCRDTARAPAYCFCILVPQHCTHKRTCGDALCSRQESRARSPSVTMQDCSGPSNYFPKALPHPANWSSSTHRCTPIPFACWPISLSLPVPVCCFLLVCNCGSAVAHITYRLPVTPVGCHTLSSKVWTPAMRKGSLSFLGYTSSAPEEPLVFSLHPMVPLLSQLNNSLF